MNNTQQAGLRVLSIDPANRGIGFAILEGPESLIDWGVREVRDNVKYRYLKRIKELIERYQPDVVVVEDFSGKGSRRCKRVKELIREVIKLALERKLKTYRFSRLKIKEAFSNHGRATKHQLATAISEIFPELSPRLPPYRKPWMPEDYRMAIFDAISLALTFYYFKSKRYAK